VEVIDRDLVEAQPDIGRRSILIRLVRQQRFAHDIDGVNLDRLDFELAAEQRGWRPLDTCVLGAEPHALIVHQRDVSQRCGLQRVALEAREAKGSEWSDLAAIYLRQDEGAAAVTGDPEAQRDRARRKKRHHDHQTERDTEPDRISSASLCAFHQKACPMEI